MKFTILIIECIRLASLFVLIKMKAINYLLSLQSIKLHYKRRKF